jgi:valyl-tRNA synthetase
MSLEKIYDPQVIEPRLQTLWQAAGVHDFSPPDGRPVYAIDTPPATVSGRLHLGHVYSTHT